jgi:hypothetical protein
MVQLQQGLERLELQLSKIGQGLLMKADSYHQQELMYQGVHMMMQELMHQGVHMMMQELMRQEVHMMKMVVHMMMMVVHMMMMVVLVALNSMEAVHYS